MTAPIADQTANDAHDHEESTRNLGAIAVLKRGVHESPELLRGFVLTAVMALSTAAGKLASPILISQVLDHGFTGGFQSRYVYTRVAVVAVLVVASWLLSQSTYRRVVLAAENSLYGLRVKLFTHIHTLSIADQSEERRGALVSRVTNDIEQLALFMEWGGVAWIRDTVQMLGAYIAMSLISGRLALVAFAVLIPMWPILRFLQKRMVVAYGNVRTGVGSLMSETSDFLMGSAVVRAYGIQDQSVKRVYAQIESVYQAKAYANRFSATIFPTGDLFGAIAVASVTAAGARWGFGWHVSFGNMVAFIFFINLFLEPLGELSEQFDQTQNAISSWRKILGVLDIPADVVEPIDGQSLAAGALAVSVRNVNFSYRTGGLVLDGVTIELPAGSHIAVVGETGSGKTTFAKLLCRLADPSSGELLVGGVELRTVDARSRRNAIRLVPQDGFLFATTIRENVRYGRDDATDQDVLDAFAQLGLADWANRLPEGLDTQAGERGDALSVGERQLVALARAQLSAPGLLILDEATSAVDPETDQALTIALARLGEGRTTVAIAHRLSTAERADSVVVFDKGRIVEVGHHEELVSAGGHYAKLYESWLGNTRA